MKIGFIGAGKVGVTLGKYFSLYGKKVQLTGYYSQSYDSTVQAAGFTQSKAYSELEALVKDSDTLFLTVPDGKIEDVWDCIRELPLSMEGKIICHTSGALSSAVFSGIESKKAFGYSVHPLFAISDKLHSYKELSQCLFTIEGAKEHLDDVRLLLESCGNMVEVIDQEVKAKYHGAAVMASNQMLALAYLAEQSLLECGFSEEHARKALTPLMIANLEHWSNVGAIDALTGPVERNDVETVHKHLQVFKDNEEQVYRQLSNVLVEIAQKKHETLDYGQMLKELNRNEKHS